MIDTGTFGATSDTERHAVFWPHRPGFQERPDLREPFPDSSADRRGLGHAAILRLNPTWQVAGQVTWTHTFSPTTLNDVTAGMSRVEGVLGTGAKDYTVPSISVNGIGVDSSRPSVWASRRETSFSITITGATFSPTCRVRIL